MQRVNDRNGDGRNRAGVPSVLLSMDQFKGLMETIEILSDQKAMRGLRLSLKQAEKGQWVSHEAVLVEKLCERVSGTLYQGSS